MYISGISLQKRTWDGGKKANKTTKQAEKKGVKS